jgi:hypothetical protein
MDSPGRYTVGTAMEINLTTPALLFPAVSLLMLAYTNRFVVLANLIRTLYADYKTNPQQNILEQLRNLRYRVNLIRNMQAFGVVSILLSVLCMFLLFEGWLTAGKWVFGASLLCLMSSLLLSLREIQLSVHALNTLLNDMEEHLR